MQSSSMSSCGVSDADAISYAASTLPRRIRHITSIQIRNLTPFPVRDALASALSKPSEQPQFTPYGYLSDDLDVTVGRKRGRRISATNSVHSGSRGEEEEIAGSLDRHGEPTLRRRASSKASIPLSTSAGSSSPRFTRGSSNVGATSTVRPSHRPRTLSLASSHSQNAIPSTSSVSSDFGTSTSSFFPDLLRDTSQKKLEKIVQSRLVETFITITLLLTGLVPDDDPHGERSAGPPSSTQPSSPTRSSKDMTTSKSAPSRTMLRRGTVGAGSTPTSPRSPTTPTRHGASSSVSSAATKSGPSAHGKSASVALSNGKTSKPTSTPSANKAHNPMSPLSVRTTSASSTLTDTSHKAAISPESSEHLLPVPDYISPIHWPSTNPVFQLSRDEFAPGTDLSGARMRVEVWGRTSPEGSNFRYTSGDVKGKGKEKQLDRAEGDSEWKVLESWEVALNELRPLSEELYHNPAHMPSNTLLITLSTGETFYLPPRSLRSSLQSRTPSPIAGYNSDPETEVHRVKGTGEIGLQSPKIGSLDSMPTSPTISELDGTHRKRRAVKSASWQDLLKLINLQTVILDTEHSLGEVVRQIDKAVVHNEALTLSREVSEREAWLSELQAERSAVDQDSEALRARISARREDLRTRRELLVHARQLHEEDFAQEVVVEGAISEERTRLSSLRRLLPIMRSNLISIVSFIYPIDLVSPPDLLFSILDVPLPIPVAATDPAPPLSLPAFKDVTEDTVATALGYSAQAVQLLSAYMGHRLVYPVTCVGSRSMIKDGISAMVGPRNFPLFSKGVDTYRFEYGVFLLNKDIEMLMSERNLRALDMRHTLPNLKNLLLTLTDNVQRRIPGHRATSSSVSISSLQSQSSVPATSSLPSDSKASTGSSSSAQSTPSVDNGTSDASEPMSASGTTSASENGTVTGASTGSTPPASGTTTPTKAAQRKSRTFLDLAPLTGFLTLRGRYTASQKPTVRTVTETPDSEPPAETDASGSGVSGEEAQSEAGDEDESDRRTIRGVRTSGTLNGNGVGEDDIVGEVVEGKGGRRDSKGGTANANANANGNGREKVVDDAVARSPPLVLSS